MITECNFTENQLGCLARAVARVLAEDGVDMSQIGGLEIDNVSDYGNGEYRLHYSYELVNGDKRNSLRQNNWFVKFHICNDDVIDDFRLSEVTL